jgi:hypothetical protein
MLDVVEHFADPLGSTRRLVDRLTDDGVLMIQTPCYEKITDPNWRMFHPPEHTFLFSKQSIRDLVARLGLIYTAFEPSIFSDDMFLFASRRPLVVNPPEVVAERLGLTPDGRLVLAMQDLYRMYQEECARPLSDRTGGWALGKAFFRAVLRKMGLQR